jgi:hypothetical protein
MIAAANGLAGRFEASLSASAGCLDNTKIRRKQFPAGQALFRACDNLVSCVGDIRRRRILAS